MAHISRNSPPIEKAGCTAREAPPSGSEWPRGGSLIISLMAMAMRMPGRPTSMRATRQEKFWASHPPATAPSMVPMGMPRA